MNYIDTIVYDETGISTVSKLHRVPADEKNEPDKHHHLDLQPEHDHEAPALIENKYYCLRRCEGKKTYDKSGDCPVCGIHLQKIISFPSKRSVYSCPIHPVKKQDRPGRCSTCGLDLVLEKSKVVSEDVVACRRMAKKFWVALAFSVPVFLIAMSDLFSFLNLGSIASRTVWNWVQLVLVSPVIFYSSRDFFKRGWSSLRLRKPNLWTLLSFGIGAAYLFSISGLLFPGVFRALYRDSSGNVMLYFEATAVIITLVLSGQVLELRAQIKSNSFLKALSGLVPNLARLIRNGREEEITLEAVLVGDILRVRPGEKIPVDGMIIEGTALLDESMFTGEQVFSFKSVNEKVTTGSINGNSVFEMKTERVGRNTLLARIIEMISQAGSSQAPIQKRVDIVSNNYVLIVLSVSFISFLVCIWVIGGPKPAFVFAFLNAVSALIISYPGILGLSIPISIMVGTGRFARSGILVKDARAIEEINKVDTLIIDNTSTLTEGTTALKRSSRAIKSLQKMGIKVYMLTGDNEHSAKSFAGELTLDGYKADCLPEDKYRRVKELQDQGHIVAMAGDDINDATALAQANICIALGTGIAIKNASITLVNGELNGFVKARNLGIKLMRNIKQNLFFAFVYNIIGIPIATVILYPVFGILLSPVIAAAAMSFSPLSMLTNALRLQKL